MIITIVALIIEFFFLSLMSISESTDMGVVSIVLLFINSMLTLIGISNSTNRYGKRIKSIITISFFLHIAVMFWNIYFNNVFTLPNTEGDAEAYAQVAISYAFGSRAGLPLILGYFPSYAGFIYKLIGVQRITIQFINIHLAIWAIVLICHILYRAQINEDIVYKVIRIIALLPNLLIISSAFLQESLVAFLLVLSVYCYVKWFYFDGTQWFVFAIIISLLAGASHMGGLVTAVSFVAVYSFIDSNHSFSISPSKMIAGIFGILIMLALISAGGSVWLKKVGGELTAENVLYASGVREAGGSGYSIELGDSTTTLGMIVNTPIRMIYFLFAPLPWNWRGFADLLAFFGSTIFYIIVVKKTRTVLKNKAFFRAEDSYGIWVVIGVSCLLATIMFAWGVSNSGSALRHREKFTYLFGILYAITQSYERKYYEFNGY